jgi:hypothetical protein
MRKKNIIPHSLKHWWILICVYDLWIDSINFYGMHPVVSYERYIMGQSAQQ